MNFTAMLDSPEFLGIQNQRHRDIIVYLAQHDKRSVIPGLIFANPEDLCVPMGLSPRAMLRHFNAMQREGILHWSRSPAVVFVPIQMRNSPPVTSPKSANLVRSALANMGHWCRRQQVTLELLAHGAILSDNRPIGYAPKTAGISDKIDLREEKNTPPPASAKQNPSIVDVQGPTPTYIVQGTLDEAPAETEAVAFALAGEVVLDCPNRNDGHRVYQGTQPVSALAWTVPQLHTALCQELGVIAQLSAPQTEQARRLLENHPVYTADIASVCAAVRKHTSKPNHGLALSWLASRRESHTVGLGLDINSDEYLQACRESVGMLKREYMQTQLKHSQPSQGAARFIAGA